MFYDETDNVVQVSKKDIIDNGLQLGIVYNYTECNDIFEDNTLLFEDSKVTFNFTSSMSVKLYEGSISAYTYLDLITSCIKNEFKQDIKAKTALVDVYSDYSQPEHLFVNICITVQIIKNDKDISLGDSIENFITRIDFVRVATKVVIDLYNDVVKEAATNARIIKIAEPKL